MECITTNSKKNNDNTVFLSAENKFSIKIRDDIKKFVELNSGGHPVKDIILVDGEEYEIRVFLSMDKNEKNYYIEKPMNYFLDKTKGKIVPIGIDSGDNYYCVNNENGKVYYWSADENQYYCIANCVDEFIVYFE